MLVTALLSTPLLWGPFFVESRTRLAYPPPTPIIEDRHGRFLTEGLAKSEELVKLGQRQVMRFLDQLKERIIR